jgi:ElaB/YqjD/DUF883 family membrane-anchored ribosome-binding protein
MTDTSALIQEQMEETKTQLSEKLESLDQQLHVSDAVQTTRSAVAATVEAVQATAETVSGAMQSVSNAFDVRRQIEQHPWMVFGGAAALGYLAHELLTGTELRTAQSLEAATTLGEFPPMNGHAPDHRDPPAHVAATAATRAYNETLMMSSPLLQLKSLAVNTLLGVAREAATRAVPLLADYLTANLDRTRIHSAEVAGTEPPTGV